MIGYRSALLEDIGSRQNSESNVDGLGSHRAGVRGQGPVSWPVLCYGIS